MKNKTEKTKVKEVKKVAAKKTKPEQKKDFWGGLGNFVRKAVDCCLE